MIKMLLIEDDKQLNDSICFFFRSENYDIDGCFCADEAFKLMEDKKYDIVLTDVMLPSVDGFEIAGMLRLYDPMLPIMFLTALEDSHSKERGYELGIDDYMTKPVALNELLWHVKALLRRSGATRSQKLEVCGLTLDAVSMTALYKDTEISMTVREFNILFNFLANPGEIFTRGRLMEKFWDDDSDSTLRSVDVYITKIREKIRQCAGIEIVTVRGLGYKAVVRGENTL